jgi:hypothetical protein
VRARRVRVLNSVGCQRSEEVRHRKREHQREQIKETRAREKMASLTTTTAATFATVWRRFGHSRVKTLCCVSVLCSRCLKPPTRRLVRASLACSVALLKHPSRLIVFCIGDVFSWMRLFLGRHRRRCSHL